MGLARPNADRSTEVDALWLALGRILLAAARDHPPAGPERDLSESTDEPAFVRKQRRQRQGQA